MRHSLPYQPSVLSFAAATDTSSSLMRHFSQTSLPLHGTTLMQHNKNQSIDSSSTWDASATNKESSAKVPETPSLFSATSKYHPDQMGLSRRRQWLVVDFDGTCTEHDTTPLLPRLAAFAAHRRRSSITAAAGYVGDEENLEESIHKQDLERRLSQFRLFEKDFARRYSEAKSTLLPGKEEGSEEKQQSISMHDVLDALDEPLTIISQMVSESGVLDGLGHVDARGLEGILQLHGVTDLDSSNNDEHVAGRTMDGDDANGKINANDDGIDKVEVRLRHGCEDTLARILSDNKNKESCVGWSLAVLSINWCPALIEASLIQPVLKKRRSILRVESCETEIPVWCNHVNEEGKVSWNVSGALAKRDRIMELRRNIQQSDDGSSGVIIYVGDSLTDLAALLEADIGIIIMGNSSSTAMIAEWGVKLVPLSQRSQHGFGSSEEDVGNWRKRKMLWTVDSWQEIDEMITELDEYWS